MIENNLFYQQGDVLFKKVESIPGGTKKRKGNILVEGEATGHNHHVATKIACWAIFMKGIEMFLENKKEIEIRHQEHGPIILPPGAWKVDRVLEYDHFLEETRRVID